MLIINDDEWFNLDHCAVGLILVLLIFVQFLKISTLWYGLLLLFLILLLGYFYQKIRSNTKLNIHITKQQWFIDFEGQLHPVRLKGYWWQTQFACISLHGPEKSISFLVRRSIIGAEKFSQLNAIITRITTL